MDKLPETLAELEALKKQIEQKQALLKECPQQKYKEGMHQLLQTKDYTIPPQYIDLLSNIQDKDPSDIVKTIFEEDKFIRFPIFMVLLQVLHNGLGYALADIINFPVDRILDACRDHDPSTVLLLLNEQLRTLYGLDMDKYHVKSTNTEATRWLNTVMSGLQFITYIIEESEEPKSKIFALALNFMMGKIIAYDDYSILTILHGIPNSTIVVNGHYGIFNQLVDEVNSNGSDYMFSKAILPAFKGIDIDSI